MSKPLRILLIGCGGIRKAHLPTFDALPDQFELAGASDPSPHARAGMAEHLETRGGAPVFEDHRQALDALAGTIDGAIILTPHFLHYPQARDCLEAGVPVLVEKPVANNLAEAQALLALSQSTGVPLMAGQTRRFDPKNIWLRHWLREDPSRFGALRTFEMSGWQSIDAWIATKEDPNADFWILDKERAGGGVVVSLLVHALDLLRFLFDEDYVEVSARGRFDPPFKNGAESSCTALLTTASGATGTLHGNYLARKTPYCEAFKFFGENGCIGEHPGSIGSYSGPAYHGSTGGKPADSWNFQFENINPVPDTLAPGVHESSFTNMHLEFAAAIREKREPACSIRQNLNTMAVIEAIYRSMQAGGASVNVMDLLQQ